MRTSWLRSFKRITLVAFLLPALAFMLGTAHADPLAMKSVNADTYLSDSLTLAAGGALDTQGNLAPVSEVCTADCGLASQDTRLSPDTSAKLVSVGPGSAAGSPVFSESSGVLVLSPTSQSNTADNTYRQRMYDSL